LLLPSKPIILLTTAPTEDTGYDARPNRLVV
jgi:hypothetical protein